MAVDVKEAVTRKLGPLPVWGWALAVAGAFIGWRLLSGRSAFPTAAPAATTPSGTPISGDGGDGGAGVDLSGIMEQIGDLTEQVTATQGQVVAGQEQIAGLGTALTNVTAASGLQQRLIEALNKRASALAARGTAGREKADAAILYKDKKISKANYTKRVKAANAKIAAQNTILGGLDTLIADLQRQLSQIGATT